MFQVGLPVLIEEVVESLAVSLDGSRLRRWGRLSRSLRRERGSKSKQQTRGNEQGSERGSFQGANLSVESKGEIALPSV
jgi:hypothetical protein